VRVQHVTLALLALATAWSRDRAVVDLTQTVKLESPIPCDGDTNPQQEIILKAAFTPADGWQRSFIIDSYQDQSCKVDIGVKCFKRTPAGWRDDWQTDNYQPSGTTHYWLNSCRNWGGKDAAQYTLSGWYKEGPPNKKLPWKQAPVKQVSTSPEVYEFSDPQGGTARVEIERR
jgi:hypothetical protein